MKTRLFVLALGVGALAAFVTPRAESQVRVGIHFVVPLPPVHREAVPPSPFRDAVWVRGYWSWDDYAGRYIWIAGHWEAPPPPPVYCAPAVKYRHVPNGVAKGWWKKHGGEVYSRDYRDDD